VPPGHSQDLRRAKLPYRQLNNPSCHVGNLAAHIPTCPSCLLPPGSAVLYLRGCALCPPPAPSQHKLSSTSMYAVSGSTAVGCVWRGGQMSTAAIIYAQPAGEAMGSAAAAVAVAGGRAIPPALCPGRLPSALGVLAARKAHPVPAACGRPCRCRCGATAHRTLHGASARQCRQCRPAAAPVPQVPFLKPLKPSLLWSRQAPRVARGPQLVHIMQRSQSVVPRGSTPRW
jgi:hypothetical protein